MMNEQLNAKLDLLVKWCQEEIRNLHLSRNARTLVDREAAAAAARVYAEVINFVDGELREYPADHICHATSEDPHDFSGNSNYCIKCGTHWSDT
jgi:hypothetical protein